MDNQLTVVQALNEVMKSVGAIAKKDRNQAQGFNFRGIDAVVNAVSPALQKFGVVAVPQVLDYKYETVEIGRNRTAMGHVKVVVTYRFYGPAGDTIESTVAAEAMDSGDKASAKAMSVAFRTALLQTLCLPTDEVDPDATSYERSNADDVLSPSAVMMKITSSSDIEALASVGQYITGNKDKFSADNLDLFRQKFKEQQLRLNPPALDVETADEQPVATSS
jgi:hypothetical protein